MGLLRAVLSIAALSVFVTSVGGATEVQSQPGGDGAEHGMVPRIQVGIDWEKTKPIEFLEYLQSQYGYLIVYEIPQGWISEDDIGELISQLESEDQCAMVVSTFDLMLSSSTELRFSLSTVGNEALKLVLGFRTDRYPPFMSGSVDEQKQEAIAWWRDR